MSTEKTLTEYLSNVRSELTRTTWHFTPDQAARIVMKNIDILQNYYNERTPSWAAAMQVGFDQ